MDAKTKKIIAIVTFAVGLATLVAGLVFLFVKLAERDKLQDGEYLVSAKEWVLDEGTNCVATDGESSAEAANADTEPSNAATNCMPSVIWKFTEIGKGTLTTNGHINDYDFIWAIEGDMLRIETKWLYDLEGEYTYELDQGAKTLTLKSDDEVVKFVGVFENN